MKKIFTNKKAIITVLSILLVLSIMLSTTYALFMKVNTLDNTESYTSGILDITVEEGTALTLSNTLPMTDEEGSALTPYTFKVTNTGNLAYTFDLKLLSTTVNNQINPAYIKVKLDDNSPVTLSSLSEGLIASDLTLNPSDSVTMSVRIWLSIDTPNTEIGKSFSAKIVTDGVGSEYVAPSTGADYIESLLTSNPETMNNDDPDGNVRYMGADPNNYVSFNNELWRIIGVFDVASTDGGPTEKRLKIIRNESLGNMAWDSANTNNWTTASLQTYLNGEYYNDLPLETKSLIDDTYWNLGGTATYTSSSNGLASHFYGYERETTVYSGRPTYWIGKIGLMYPSDYGYATSGGSTTDRTVCLNKEVYNWKSSKFSDCKNNDWLYESGYVQWTLSPSAGFSTSVHFITTSGNVNTITGIFYSYGVCPVAFLKSNIKIVEGDGSSSNPYILQS